MIVRRMVSSIQSDAPKLQGGPQGSVKCRSDTALQAEHLTIA